jgi:hypothetical protein
MKRPRIRAQVVDWALEAWLISEALTNFYSQSPAPKVKKLSGMDALRALADPESFTLRVPFSKAKAVIRLRHKIAGHLTHWLVNQPPIRRCRDDPHAGLHFLAMLKPEAASDYIRKLQAQGIEFDGGYLWAVRSYQMLGRVLAERTVPDPWQQRLPLSVALIGGKSASLAAICKAEKLRGKRPNALREKKAKARLLNKSASWKQILHTLKDAPDADDRIVNDWDDEVIHWTSPDGMPKTTKTGTFRNWK